MTLKYKSILLINLRHYAQNMILLISNVKWKSWSFDQYIIYDNNLQRFGDKNCSYSGDILAMKEHRHY